MSFLKIWFFLRAHYNVLALVGFSWFCYSTGQAFSDEWGINDGSRVGLGGRKWLRRKGWRRRKRRAWTGCMVVVKVDCYQGFCFDDIRPQNWVHEALLCFVFRMHFSINNLYANAKTRRHSPIGMPLLRFQVWGSDNLNLQLIVFLVRWVCEW